MPNTKKSVANYSLPGIIILLILIIIVYSKTIHYPFHYDDIGVAIKSDIIESSLSDFWEKTTGIFIHRLFLLYTFALNYHWGNGTVESYHLLNIIFHLLSSLLIYLISAAFLNQSPSTKEKTKLFSNQNYLISIPLLSSLIFAIHPLNTETVTYISSRSSGMVTFFFLLSFYLFIQGTSHIYRNSNGKVALLFYFFSLLAFIIGLGTKETIATLPAIIFLYLYYFVNKEENFLKFLIKFKWYFTSIALPVFAYLAYRKATIGSIFFAQTDEGMRIYGRYYYFLTELKVVIFYYLKLFFFPINLNIYPSMPVSTSIFDFQVLVSVAIILSLMALALITCRGNNQPVPNKIISFSILWFFITLIPTSSFIPLNDLISEHRAYLPSVGVSFFSGTILYSFIFFLDEGKKLKFLKNLSLLIILALMILLATKRNSVWESDYTLWKDSVVKTPYLAKPHMNLGAEYNNRGLNILAAEEFKIAIKLFPEYAESYYNLGKVYFDLHQYEKAILEFLLAIRYDKSYYLAQFSLGNTYSKLKQYNKAINAYQKADQIFHNKEGESYLEAIHNAGEVYGQMGKLDEAIEQFKKVLKIDPSHVLANENLSRGYRYGGDIEKADLYLKKAGQLKQKN